MASFSLPRDTYFLKHFSYCLKSEHLSRFEFMLNKSNV